MRLSLILLCGLFCLQPASAHVYPGPESERDQVHLGKGEHNPHPGWLPQPLRESGGPDAGGYVYRDSQEPDGPLFNWEDISGSGTPINGFADDAFHGPLALPFTFNFYADSYDEIYICSNGMLAFGGGNTVYDNEPLPSGGAPNNLICLFWDDLNPASGGTVYYGEDPQGNWICQFDAVREFGAGGTITAEVILHQDGTVVLQYLALSGGIDVNGETIGIENESGSIGLMTSLDDEPAAYPFDELAILFEQLPPDATVSGLITATETGDPLPDARVRFGALETLTGPDGAYTLPEIWSGSYDVHISKNGFYDHRQAGVELLPGANSYNAALDSSSFPAGLVGLWTFDDPGDLTAATAGNDLVLSGSHTPATGPEPGDGAANIGVGSFYRCYHDIPANGQGAEPAWVNQFTLVMDVRIPASDWQCLYQTNWSNSNDGDWFINSSGQTGVNDTGYSEYAMVPDEWYRLGISVNLGVHYNYFLDGQLLHLGGAQTYEGRFSLYPGEGVNQVLFFADDNGEDGPLDVARIALFDRPLSSAEMSSLDGYGHEFEEPEIPYMAPYLQTPTPNSVYVSWHSATTTESLVQYGASPDLDQSTTGDCHQFDGSTWWHTVQLTGLLPETEYYYRCVTGTDSSRTHIFRTQPPDSGFAGHIRFLVYGDTRTDFTAHRMVIDAMKEKITELYGDDIHNHINLLFNVGDIVSSGPVLSQYIDEHFNPILPLSGDLPYMISIGNHEAEAAHFYNYMKYEDWGGPEGERYYSFRIGPVLFIALNSNTQGTTQLDWLEQQVAAAETDQEITMVFAFLHHPGHSEVWPDGNTAWVQDQVLPLLVQYSKVEHLTYGHSHNYERGALPEGNLRILLSGGGGSALDRWGMYANQTDYDELHRSFDHYCYNLFDIDCADNSYTARTYTLGHTDLPLANELMDSWLRDRNASPPLTSLTLAPADSGGYPLLLVASPCQSDYPVMTSHFQVSYNPEDWNSPLVDERRDWENIYYDTGAPLWEPIDLNEGIDLTRLPVDDDLIAEDATVWWRVRYRDQNLLWSEWSQPQSFLHTSVPIEADFTADVTIGTTPLEVQFSDLSRGEVQAWEWDLDGDAVIDSDEQDPGWIYEAPGEYTVTLNVYYDLTQSSETKMGYIHALAGVGTLTITLAGSELLLSWPGDPGYNYYRIYSATEPYGLFELTNTTAHTTFSVPLPAERQFFRVTGVVE